MIGTLQEDQDPQIVEKTFADKLNEKGLNGKDDIEGYSKLPNSLGNTNAYSNLIADGRFLNSTVSQGIRGFGDSGDGASNGRNRNA